MLNINIRISNQELENIFGVDRATIENWRKNHGLPIIEISSHSKYIRVDDLIEWENKHIQSLITL
jgi:phage terminase Nu1 subunit (DNA packaging protein)